MLNATKGEREVMTDEYSNCS